MSIADLLARKVWLAPMAGGVTTVDLAVAVGGAGGMPTLAAGYLPADAVAADLVAFRERHPGPVGVNVFTPQPRTVSAEQLRRYSELLAPVAERLGSRLGEPVHDDDDYEAKIDALVQEAPALVTFTFGLPTAHDVSRLHGAGVTVGVTVTCVEEGRRALEIGADVLIAQAASAGGHRSTHDPLRKPGSETVADLLYGLLPLDAPVVVAGGIVDAAGVEAALRGGAAAVSCGTAFLLADEAGTSGVHRQALQDARFSSTVVTRAFTGRPARALTNAWTRLGVDAPTGYPDVHWLTRDLRRAAAHHCNPEWVHLWAGERWQDIRAAPAAEIVTALLSDGR
ncbi:nitronate monooxygenase [uncultured Agrococcus sp.]|uniref:NAD(P)H-dependent flavin oxidoreductase n=1 Tax=uncultured Agrococcus sp. TaxID=382258 RepID=UPI0025E9E1E7|nr:nitronate monooxygenase [uncultured Agrococcus sp.]